MPKFHQVELMLSLLFIIVQVSACIPLPTNCDDHGGLDNRHEYCEDGTVLYMDRCVDGTYASSNTNIQCTPDICYEYGHGMLVSGEIVCDGGNLYNIYVCTDGTELKRYAGAECSMYVYGDQEEPDQDPSRTDTDEPTETVTNACDGHGGLASEGIICGCNSTLINVLICEDGTQVQSSSDIGCTPDRSTCPSLIDSSLITLLNLPSEVCGEQGVEHEGLDCGCNGFIVTQTYCVDGSMVEDQTDIGCSPDPDQCPSEDSSDDHSEPTEDPTPRSPFGNP